MSSPSTRAGQAHTGVRSSGTSVPHPAQRSTQVATTGTAAGVTGPAG